MPSRLDNVRIPSALDRRKCELTDEDRKQIKHLYFVKGFGIRQISRLFEDKCSRRLIQFILFPERAELVHAQYKENRLDGRYYDRERTRLAIASLRKYKKELLNKGLIKNL